MNSKASIIKIIQAKFPKFTQYQLSVLMLNLKKKSFEKNETKIDKIELSWTF